MAAHLIFGILRGVGAAVRVARQADRAAQAAEERARYQGSRLRGKPHGQGVMHYRNGSIYTGSFVNGERSGFGTLRHPSGSIAEGQWLNDKLSGQGWTRAANGAEYHGEFLAGVFNGTGFYRYSNGTVFNGNYVNGKQRGPGEITWPQGLLFRGMFLENQKHGVGIQCDLNKGICWEQKWENGKLLGSVKLETHQVPSDLVARFGHAPQIAGASNSAPSVVPPITILPTVNVVNLRLPGIPDKGVGERTYTGPVLASARTVPHGLNGKMVEGTWTYEGGFEKGRFHGPGRTTMANGSVREGIYFQSKLCGRGSYTNATSHSLYTGNFSNSKFEGKGTMKMLKTGIVYDCEWRAGIPNGYGTITWPDKVYVGQIKNFLPDGPGRMKWHALQHEFVGTFKGGLRVQGTMWYKSPTMKLAVYQGSFLASKIHGRGKCIFRSGWMYEGEWKESKMDGEGILVRLSDGLFKRAVFQDSKATLVIDTGVMSPEALKNFAQIEGLQEEVENEGTNGDVPMVKAETCLATTVAATVQVYSAQAGAILAVTPEPSAPPYESQSSSSILAPSIVSSSSSSIVVDHPNPIDQIDDDESAPGESDQDLLQIDDDASVSMTLADPTKVKSWSVQDVVEWIDRLKPQELPNVNEFEPGGESSSSIPSEGVSSSSKSQLHQIFASACVDGEELLALKTEPALVEIGVPPSIASFLLIHIKELRELNSSKVESSVSSPVSSSATKKPLFA